MTPFSRIDEAPGRGRLRRMIAALVLSLVASFGLLWAPLSRAASDVPPGGEVGPWTLARVLDAARAASPAALAASAHGRAGEADGAAAWSALLPHVAFRAGLTRSDDPALLFAQRLQQGKFTSQDFAIESLNQPGPRNALEYGLVLDQPLWNGAAEVTAPSMASHAKGEARAAARAERADALLDAVRRYVAYISARERVAADSVGLAAVRSAHASAVERHGRGQIPDLDTLRTFAREAEGRERWLLSVRDRELARRRLADVIGVSPADGEIPSPAPADPNAFLVQGTDAGADSAIVAPELGAARERANRLGLEADRASHRLLPSLNGRASLSYYRDPDAGGEAERRWFAGLALDWPLFDGTQRWNEKKAASARADGARAELESVRRELAAREEAARRDLEIAGPRRDAARAARDASHEALRLAVARYRAGLLPLDDLLAVDAEAATARERLIAREADVELAGYTYLHATGRLK